MEIWLRESNSTVLSSLSRSQILHFSSLPLFATSYPAKHLLTVITYLRSILLLSEKNKCTEFSLCMLLSIYFYFFTLSLSASIQRPSCHFSQSGQEFKTFIFLVISCSFVCSLRYKQLFPSFLKSFSLPPHLYLHTFSKQKIGG